MGKYYDEKTSAEVGKYGHRVIEDNKDTLYDAGLASIAYLAQYPTTIADDSKKPPRPKFTAKLMKASLEVVAISKKNYILVVDGLWWDTADATDREKEIMHCLLHIKQVIKDSEVVWKMKKHDVEEFSVILAKYYDYIHKDGEPNEGN